MKLLNKKELEKYYLLEEMTPYEIGELFKVDHKTVRKYLRLYEIPLRSASEYNYLAKKTHESPLEEDLNSSLSIAAHTAYLCEGWHTEKTSILCFSNTDPLLIKLFVRCLTETYKVKKITFFICAKTLEEAQILLKLFPTSSITLDSERKTPIVRVRAGGKILAKEFISNAYSLLVSLG